MKIYPKKVLGYVNCHMPPPDFGDYPCNGFLNQHFFHFGCFLESANVDSCIDCSRWICTRNRPYLPGNHMAQCGASDCGAIFGGCGEMWDNLDQCRLCEKRVCKFYCVYSCGICENGYVCRECYPENKGKLMRKVPGKLSPQLVCETCMDDDYLTATARELEYVTPVEFFPRYGEFPL
ncbi:hypothetical protein ABW19_dt0202919 [Dactylella cylindrospora]|nr:hypothetical protein ABW19_dt0202919 [Dactylella cylindrospora]